MTNATWVTASLTAAAVCLISAGAGAQPPAPSPPSQPEAPAPAEATSPPADAAPAEATSPPADAAPAEESAEAESAMKAQPGEPQMEVDETVEPTAAAGDPAKDDDEEGAAARSGSAPADAPATLFDSMGGKPLGGFGGVGVVYTQLAQEDVVAVCGEGALIFADHALSIGGGGCGVVSDVDGESFGTDPIPGDKLNFGYGGLIVRYHFLSKEVANISLGALVGAGGVAITNWRGDGAEDDLRRAHAQAVFVAEPQLGVHLNIVRWLRFGATVGYRVAAGVVIDNLDNSDLSALVVGGTFHIGRF